MVKTGQPAKLFSDEEVHEFREDTKRWVDEEKGGLYEVFYVRWYYHKHKMTRDDFHKLTERQEFRPYF